MGAAGSEQLRSEVAAKLHGVKLEEAFQEDSVSFFQFKRAAELLGLRVTEAQLRAAFTPFQVDGRMNCAEFIRFVRRRSSGAKRLESPKDVLSDASEMGVRRSAARIADSIFEKEVDLRQAFRAWDKKNLGGLDVAEFQGALASLGFDAAADVVEAVFKAFDLKGDGRVSCWEFTRSLHQLQAAAEATTSEEERRARRDKKKAAALRKQGNQLAVFGAGLGGGHLEAAALSGAIAQNDAASLRKALRAAEDVGLDAEHLQDAKRKLRELEEKDAAADALKDALLEPLSVERLQRAVADGEAAGLGEEGLREARKSLAKEEWKDQVRKRLDDAVQRRDMEELREALADGEAANLPEPELSPARELCAEEARRARARRALAEALDRAALEEALRLAEGAGLSEPEVSPARRRLEELKDKDAAEQELKDAILSRDMFALKKALESQCEVDPALLAEAKRLLSECRASELRAEQEARRAHLEDVEVGRCFSELAEKAKGSEKDEAERARVAAEEAELAEQAELEERKERARKWLRRTGSDVEELRRALEEAGAAGLAASEMARAQAALSQAERRAAAKSHLQSAEGEELRAALEEAEACGVGEAELERAREMLRREDVKAVAKRRLEDAMESRDVEALRVALEAARGTGLELREAEELLKSELRKMECLEKLKSNDPNVLRSLLASELSESQRLEAQQRLAAWEATQAAEERLRRASAARDVKELRGALAASEGVALEVVEEAKSILAEEERKEDAKRALQKALVSRKNLSEVLKEAEAAGLSSKELEPARAALAMDDEKVKVRRRLQQAISERHLGQLKAALALAERVKLLPEEMRPPRDLLKELEAKELAKKKLLEAIASRDPASLRSAIQKASGLCDVAEAKRVLAEEEAKARAREELAAAEAGDSIPDLEAALAAGAAMRPDELRGAEQRLEQLRRRQAAQEALGEALRQEDLEKLREAIEAAEVEGVELLEARDVERRLTAKEALLGAKGEEQLRRALEKARGVLEEEDLRPFEESLERFEEQRSFEEAKEKAKELLREAKDVEALRSAIHMAQKAHLDVELDIQRLRDLEVAAAQAAEAEAARRALDAALASGDEARLRAAVERSKAFQDVAEAEEVLQGLERRAAARWALQEALNGRGDLEQRLLEAESLHLEEDLMKEARSKVLQDAAKRGLEEARATENAVEIRKALLKAEEFGIDVEDAKAQLAQLEALEALLVAESLEALRSAIDVAASLGLDVGAAEERLAELQRKDMAQRRLTEALATGDGLRAALEEAKEVALESLEEAEEKLKQEETRKQLTRTLQSLSDTRPPTRVPTSRIYEKAEYMFSHESLENVRDEEATKTIRQRLRKLYVSPAEVLAEAMQIPAVASSAGQDDLNVDVPVAQAFVGQLQLSMSSQRTLKFLNDREEVPVKEFLQIFGAPAAPAPASSVAAAREEKKRELMQQRRPQENLRQLILQQRVSRLSSKEAQLVTNLREALFERRSNMQKMFKSVDLNDDGVVTLEEFLHALEGAGVAVGHEIDRARACVTQEEAARMLAYFDRNSTGTLQYNEFMRLLQGTLDLSEELPLEREARRIPDIGDYQGAPLSFSGSALRAAAGVRERCDEQAVQNAFRKWDVNLDGKISERELLSVLRKIDPKIRDQDVKRLFEKADCNGDGAIDYEEFVSWLFSA